MLSRSSSKPEFFQPALFQMVDMESLVPSGQVLRKIDAVLDLNSVPDAVPDHSTMSRLSNERWAESGLFDQLMDQVLRRCCDVGLLSGRHLSLDGTEVRADVSVKSFEPRGPRAPRDIGPPNPPARKKQEPKPAGDWKGRGKSYKNDTHFSPTDPDAGGARLYRKGDQREARPSYLAHDLIDTKSRVVLAPDSGRRLRITYPPSLCE